MGMVVNCVAYANGRKIGDIAVDQISDAIAKENTFVWLGLHEPDEALMKEVQEEFGLHDLAVEDAHRAHQRPKLEAYGDSLFVVLHTAQTVEGKVQYGETHIFIGPRYVVTVRHGASVSYAPVRARCECTPDLLQKGPGFVLYALMDFVVDQYFPIVHAFGDELESLERDIFEGSFKRQTTERIYDLKRDLMALRRAAAPLLEVCNQLARFSTALIPEDTRPYYRDVYDHVIRINDASDNMREMLNTALSVNLSLVTIGQNEVVKKLAGWGAILAIPTLVASMYGMNFQYMPELQWHYGYPVVVSVTIAICGLLHRALKRAGWL